jgi:hypothetical protein
VLNLIDEMRNVTDDGAKGQDIGKMMGNDEERMDYKKPSDTTQGMVTFYY